LTVEGAQTLAILYHPKLDEARAARGFARAARIRAEISPDPTLYLTALWTIPEQIFVGLASLRWELLPSGTGDARLRLAAELSSKIDDEIAEAEWDAANDARLAWLELVAAEARSAVLSRLAETASRLEAHGDRMLAAGVAVASLTSLLQLDHARIRNELTVNEGRTNEARILLAAAAGLPPGTRVTVDMSTEPLAPFRALIPEGNLDAVLLERRPELRASLHAYRMAEHELEIACLFSGIIYSVGPDVLEDAASWYVGGGVNLKLPLTDGNRAAIAEAEAVRNRERAAFAAKFFAARAALAAARAEYAAAANALLTFEERVLPRARQVEDTNRRALAAGSADLLTAIQAQDRALRAELESLDRRVRHAVAVARLEFALGPPVSTTSDSRPIAPEMP
jgi:outer membrane protein TolC